MSIMDASLPEARWSGPTDSLYDIHYNRFEVWVNDLYERDEYRDIGFYGDFSEALESDLLFDAYMDEYNRSREP
jgi:hypothetical protein